MEALQEIRMKVEEHDSILKVNELGIEKRTS